MIGEHVVTLHSDAIGAGVVDISCLVDAVTINHGRDNPGSQPEPASASLDITVTPLDPLPAAAEIGTTLKVETWLGGVAHTRFSGRVTDMSFGWEDAGEATPDAGVGQITAINDMADLGRRVIGDIPWPQELDGPRVARILAEAGVTLDPEFSDPGTVQILPRDVDRQPALDLAREVATDAVGIVWHTRGGEVRYADSEHRRNATPDFALDACDLWVTPTWKRTLEGLVNQVSLSYGLEPVEPGEGEESGQPHVAASSLASQDRYGLYEYTATTRLAAEDDAMAQATMLMARNSSPVWIMAALPVAVEDLTEAETAALLSLDMHSLLQLTGLPAISTAPTADALWVEGWAETLSYGVHELELVVSGFCRTVPPPRWNDLNPAWTWGEATMVETGRNLLANPSFESGVAPWYNDGAAATVTSPTDTGAQSLQVTHAGGLGYIGTPWIYPTVPGAVHQYTGRVRAATVGRACHLRMYFLDAGGAVLSDEYGAPVTSSAAEWTTISLTMTAPPATVYVSVQVHVQNVAAGEVHYFDSLMLYEGQETAPAYFDGDTPDTETVTYAWTGTGDARRSTKTVMSMAPGGLPPTLTWDDATCMGPTVDRGRWADVPASLRWDQLPPDTQWDQWTAAPTRAADERELSHA